MASVKVKMDQRSVIYMRNCDTLFSGMEVIGGFHESLMHIGFLMVFFF